MPLDLDYYYGNEAEQYSFYRIPKILFTDARFRGVSVEAKVLYGLLLDRMALSVRNNWLDREGRVYIIFTVADVMELLGCAQQKANKLLNELDSTKGVGLIERIRRGLGKPNVIYVKNFTGRPRPGQERRERDDAESQIKKCENHKSGNVKITIQDLRKSQTNNTDLNKTDFSDTDPSINQTSVQPVAGRVGDRFPEEQNETDAMDAMDGTDRIDAYRRLIRANISYDALLHDSPYDRGRLDGLVELMAEACCCGRESIRINRDAISTEVVKSRFLKLDGRHIRYVLDCLDKNTTLVGNIRAYTLSALFNAPVTMEQYYASLVSHDMAEGLRGG